MALSASLSVIPSSKKINSRVEPSIVSHSYVDLLVGWYGEPHVVRVDVVRTPAIAERVEVFLIVLVVPSCE